MNTRAFTLALIFAGLAIYMVHTYISGQKAEIIKKFGVENTVVVAKVDINEFDLIDDSKVMVTSVPQNFLAPGSFKTIADVEGSIATVPILKGEQITKPRVTKPGARTGLARQVAVGKRAIAMNITDQQAVGKLIKPGDRVDVLAAIDYAAGRKDRQKIMTILQDVLVLSTGLSMTNSLPVIGVENRSTYQKMNLNTYSEYNTITLELDPVEVQKLVYVVTFSNARPFFSLRNNNDKSPLPLEPTRIFDVLDEKDSAEAKQYFNEKLQAEGGRGGR